MALCFVINSYFFSSPVVSVSLSVCQVSGPRLEGSMVTSFGSCPATTMSEAYQLSTVLQGCSTVTSRREANPLAQASFIKDIGTFWRQSLSHLFTYPSATGPPMRTEAPVSHKYLGRYNPQSQYLFLWSFMPMCSSNPVHSSCMNLFILFLLNYWSSCPKRL